MDRTHLTNLLDSGRAVALDCYAIGKEISDDDPIGRLFETDILNKSVILKRYEKVLPVSGKSTMFDADFLKQFGGGAKSAPTVNVNTVIYFPYDFDDIYGGGETVTYNGKRFLDLLAQKFAQGTPSPELLARLKKDMVFLELLDSVPSLDPFLFKCKAEQLGVIDEIHPDYFAVTAEEWEEIQLPIRSKIASLVKKALGDSTGDDQLTQGEFEMADDQTKAERDYIELFLKKIWEAKDTEGIEPFVEALKIQADDVPSVFFAWKAVCYFQFRFAQMTESLRTMFHWIGHDDLCFPTDSQKLAQTQRNRLVERRKGLREAVRDGYVSAHKILSEYEHSYNQFVNEGKPQLFLNFLENAEDSYLLLANHVSIATHSVNFWKNHMALYGAELRQEQFSELFDGLLVLYSVNRDS